FSALRIRLKEMPGAKPFRNIDGFIAELAAAERALVDVKAVSIAATLVRPVRWEAEIFGFRTVSLDIRQNTTVINRVLQEIWHKMNPVAKDAVPREGSPEMTTWIMDELNKPL